jgi:hypothetical protein
VISARVAWQVMVSPTNGRALGPENKVPTAIGHAVIEKIGGKRTVGEAESKNASIDIIHRGYRNDDEEERDPHEREENEPSSGLHVSKAASVLFTACAS